MKTHGPCIVKNCLNKGTHRLPKNKDIRKIWIKAIKIQEHSIVDNSSVCSHHFRDSDFIKSVDGIPLKKRLRKHAIPSIFFWSEADESNKENIEPVPSNFDHYKVIKTYSKQELPLQYVEEFPFINLPDLEDCDPLAECEPEVSVEIECHESNMNDIEHIKDTDLVAYTNNKIITSDKSQQITPCLELKCTTFSVHTYKHDNKAIHFYTGLESYHKFLLVFDTLGPNVDCLNYFYSNPPIHITPLEQFFLTLIILRRHDGFQEMSNRYLITVKQVSNIFITWIRFMALQWQNIDLWASREQIHYFAPLDFYDKYPYTRTVIDATEFPIKKPKFPLAQQITFSSYKNKNTVKALIGISPSGFINYVSPCYGGSASDRQIIERSDILNKFDFNDEIMVDKGLNVQDIFIGYGVKVNMPSFFKKKNQINPNTFQTDRKIASKRLHVERIIGMLKTYRILTQPMNQTEILLSSDIVFIRVCAMFVNFRRGIIHKNA